MTETTQTPEQGRFIIATLQNAHDLVVEAEILLRAQKWARAYALATFAIEEAGKAWRAHEQFYFDPKANMARLHHSCKLAAANEMATLYYR
jgi:AbiV family abortive infection protein